jgi:hypothetical protein
MELSRMVELSRNGTAEKWSLANRPIALGLAVAVFGAGLHLIQFYREIQRLQSAIEVTSPSRLDLFLILPFTLCVIGLLMRSRLGLVLSILSLGFVCFVYAKWYEYSYRLLKVISEGVVAPPRQDIVPPHPLGLVDATWLDIGILLAVLVVLAWQIKFLISTFRHRKDAN